MSRIPFPFDLPDDSRSVLEQKVPSDKWDSYYLDPKNIGRNPDGDRAIVLWLKDDGGIHVQDESGEQVEIQAIVRDSGLSDGYYLQKTYGLPDQLS